MARRSAFNRVMGRAARGPLNLGVLGASLVGAAALGLWPLAAIGGAAYAALVASDVTSAAFRRRVLSGRTVVALPEPEALADPEVRAAVAAIRAARLEVDRVITTIPERVQRNVRGALAAIEELEQHGAALAGRGEELSRYLASVDVPAATASASALGLRAAAASDPAAQGDYEHAATAALERVQALRDIGAARERTLAHLARIAAAMQGVPPKLVRLRALDDAASDALTDSVGSELQRMNIDLRAFEDTLQALTEVTP